MQKVGGTIELQVMTETPCALTTQDMDCLLTKWNAVASKLKLHSHHSEFKNKVIPTCDYEMSLTG